MKWTGQHFLFRWNELVNIFRSDKMNWSPSTIQMKWTDQHFPFRWNELVDIYNSDEMNWSTFPVQMKWTDHHLQFIWAWTEDPVLQFSSREILNLNCHMPSYKSSIRCNFQDIIFRFDCLAKISNFSYFRKILCKYTFFWIISFES